MKKTDIYNKISLKVLKALLLLIAICFLLSMLFVIASRIGYIFELEWMEGTTYETVHRLMNSEKIYIKPSLEFIPNIYTPVYFYLSALLSQIFGLNILLLRFISVISSIFLFGLVYRFVKKRTGGYFYPFLSAGLLAATFKIVSAWYDLARVDNLFVMLMFLAIYILYDKPDKKRAIISGLVFFLAFYTKQTSLLAFLGFFVLLLWVKPKTGIYFGLAFAIPSIVSFIALNNITDGWFYYYCFDLPSQHELLKNMLYHFWIYDIIYQFSVPFFIASLYVLIRLFQNFRKYESENVFIFNKFIIKFRRIKYSSLFDLVFLSTMLLISWSMRLHQGGHINALIPAYAVISIYFAIGLSKVFNKTSFSKSFSIILAFAIIIQFIHLFYFPGRYIPDEDDYTYGYKFIREVASEPGKVYIFFHSYISRLAGKESYLPQTAIWDISRGQKNDVYDYTMDLFNNAIEKKYFDAIIIDYFAYPKEMEQNYKLMLQNYNIKKTIMQKPNTFHTKSGLITAPVILLEPRIENR
ncbi:MAG: ArnT family glycosyltransferase [Candidatus Zixiibacteriota bacterium]